jgi:hypothetical protein
MDTKSAKYKEVASPEEYSGSQTDSSNDQVWFVIAHYHLQANSDKGSLIESNFLERYTMYSDNGKSFKNIVKEHKI